VTELADLLRLAVERGASDLHLKVPSPPMVRVHGHLEPLADAPPLHPETTERYVAELLDEHPGGREAFALEGEFDFSFARPGVGRFRVNAFRQRRAASIVLRVVPTAVPRLADLGLPEAVDRIAAEERGVVMVTGTTGSGKSTTLAAILDAINRREAKHIVTIEDPIEILHPDRRSIVSQREVGADTGSFSDALRRVMRQDPDVLMIGEIRDPATADTALNAAETGHLVLASMHTLDAAETVNRLIGFFPLHEQQQVRTMLAGTLRAVVSQRLVPRADGAGRVAAAEVLVATARARDMIANPEETDRLREVIREGEFYGMQTFDQSLLGHVLDGAITVEEAMRAAASPQDLKLLLTEQVS
jgi:twitching motility protein PilT